MAKARLSANAPRSRCHTVRHGNDGIQHGYMLRTDQICDDGLQGRSCAAAEREKKKAYVSLD
ncbi:hypothetical protein PG984_011946 [Apiospora sp. TS-2023a]